MKLKVRLAAFMLAVLTLLVAACGGKTYGSSSLAQVSPGTGNYSSLDVPTPSASPGSVSLPPPSGSGQQQQQTPPPPPPPQQATVTIKIQSDANASTGYFYPSAVAIEHGTKVIFVNTDSVARSVVSQPGAPVAFNSGPIAPGHSWSFTFDKAGNYQFADGTRPYANGEVQVH